MKILYVEDDSQSSLMILDMIERFFKDVSVVLATNGLDGYEKWKKDKFDLVITDYYMPKMDGEQMAIMIKRDCPSQRIILVSSTLGQVTNSQAFNDYIYKDRLRIKELIERELNGGVPLVKKTFSEYKGYIGLS